MITVRGKIKEIIHSLPLIEEAISRDLLNLSAFAREIKPELESALFKELSESAIIMALRRIATEIKEEKAEKQKITSKMKDIVVRANLIEFTFQKVQFTLEKCSTLLKASGEKQDVFLAFTQGTTEITIIAGSELKEAIRKIFGQESLISKIEDLSAITMRLPEEAVKIPGIYYTILKQLAWHHINVVEVISTLREFTIVLKSKEVDKAFSILLKYFSKP